MVRNCKLYRPYIVHSIGWEARIAVKTGRQRWWRADDCTSVPTLVTLMGDTSNDLGTQAGLRAIHSPIFTILYQAMGSAVARARPSR